MDKIGHSFAKWANKWIPNAFVFSLIFTIIVFFAGIFIAKQTPVQMVQYWGEGLFLLLPFTLQMALMVLLGHMVTCVPIIERFVKYLAGIPKESKQATVFVTFVTCAISLINWGIAIILGALVAREIGKNAHKNNIKMHYPIIACGPFLLNILLHGGLSGSTALLLATPGHFLEAEMGVIGIEQTILSPLNIIITSGLLFLTPLVMYFIHPKDEKDYVGINIEDFDMDEVDYTAEQAATNEMTPAEKMDDSKILGMLLGILGVAYIIWHFATHGFDLNLDIVLTILFITSIIGLGSPKKLMEAAAESVHTVTGIVIIFMLYASIMGMMQDSGLITIIADAFVRISTPVTYPVYTFFSACIVNMFVPSGGGQWAVQGPIAVEAATRIGVPHWKAAMAVVYGDEITNLLQPFWALPLLGIVKLQARDILGYSMVVAAVGFVWVTVMLFIL